MNTYQVKYRSEDIRSKVSMSERGNEYGYTMNETYYDLDGQIAFRGIKSIETIIKKFEAVSEDALRELFKEKVIDDMGHECKLFMDFEIKLISEGDINPFEKINPMYCKSIEGHMKYDKESLDLGEVDILCSKESQKHYQSMSIEERKEYLNEFVEYDDISYYPYG